MKRGCLRAANFFSRFCDRQTTRVLQQRLLDKGALAGILGFLGAIVMFIAGMAGFAHVFTASKEKQYSVKTDKRGNLVVGRAA